MQLDRIKIQNFRSIRELTFTVNPKCRILVGINESGKSNILKALSLLDDGVLPDSGDVRQSLPEEAQVAESAIRFYFKLSEDDKKKVLAKVCEVVLSSKDTTIILKNGSDEYTLEEFVFSRDEGIYYVDVKESKKHTRYFTLNSEWELLDGWRKVAVGGLPPITVNVNGVGKNLSTFKMVNQNEYLDIPERYLAQLTPSELNDIVGNVITNLVSESLPEVVFWKYSDKNLLPATIATSTFASNPEICIPLKNMFKLAGCEDIQKEINSAIAGPPNAFRNLLTKVAMHATKHFKRVWKDYAKVKFLLEENGSNIRVGVVEENYWSMEQRSDGFKRFISFLLQISVNAKLGYLKNTILLVDEPDVNLHISGARYLKDELIKISKDNYVIYATHSIFMMDTENIGRHIIVAKNNEITEIKDADNSNVVDEEVLNNAVGFTIYDILKKENILFEGWRDKRLFECAVESLPSEDPVRKYFSEFGFTFAKGVKDVKNVSSFLELGKRNCVIISDSDAAAKENQKKYVLEKRYGKWLRYDEVLKDKRVVTGEDFLSDEYVKPVLSEIKDRLSLSGFPNVKNGIVAGLQERMAKDKIDPKVQAETICEFKEKVFADLAGENISKTYFKFLSELMQMLQTGKGGESRR